jgi:hypothetical protein
MYGAHMPQHGQLDLLVEHNPMQFLIPQNCMIEIDGYPAARPWGRWIFDLQPGTHMVRVWFSYMGQSGLAVAQVPIQAGWATMMRYDTPFFVFMNGSLQMLGSRPMG